MQIGELDDGSFGAHISDDCFEKFVDMNSNVHTCCSLSNTKIVQMVRLVDDDVETNRHQGLRAAVGLVLALRFLYFVDNAEEALGHV